jgi:YD repeat-containing protein
MNQLKSVQNNGLEYALQFGADGAVSSFYDGTTTWHYVYDDENRLTTVLNGANTVYSCWYDAFGRPSKEVVNGQTRYLVWDGDELQYEVGTNGLVLVRYVWGPTGLLGYYNSDGLYVTRIALRDGLGHVRALMNRSTRALTDGFLYDAYGNDMNPALHDTTEGNALRFRWNGSYGYRTLPGTNVGSLSKDPSNCMRKKP